MFPAWRNNHAISFALILFIVRPLLTHIKKATPKNGFDMQASYYLALNTRFASNKLCAISASTVAA
jgi:hypothetical protein